MHSGEFPIVMVLSHLDVLQSVFPGYASYNEKKLVYVE